MPVDIEYTPAPGGRGEPRLFVPPLPRLSPPFRAEGEGRYEVIVVGAGPAGLLLTLLLARYGLSDESLLCIEAKDAPMGPGHADGLLPRTMEVLKTLGLDEIMTESLPIHEMAFWESSPSRPDCIERTGVGPSVSIPTRYPFSKVIPQGRIMGILEKHLLRHSRRGIQRNTRLVSVRIDDSGEFPVRVEVETNGQRRTVRCRHLVAADGAHSAVRRSLGLEMRGESLRYVWGVVDAVFESDFPGLRRMSCIKSSQGTVLMIPREQIETGDYLTRFYVTLSETDSEDERQAGQSRWSHISVEDILDKVQESFRPYSVHLKPGSAIDWWAAYQIGQRMLDDFVVKDASGAHRVFFVGDACHTHSPKAAQGMNISMMDSFNLAWKLAYSIHGLVPTDQTPALLDTYQTERHPNARRVLQLDRVLSSGLSESSPTPVDKSDSPGMNDLSDLFDRCNAYMTGCAVQYDSSDIVDMTPSEQNPIAGTDYLSGILHPGRRLMSVRVRRHADGNPRDLQDEFPPTGRFRILVLASTDLLQPSGISVQSLTSIGERVIPSFLLSLVEQVVLYPRLLRDFDWSDIPPVVKLHSEMRVMDGFTHADAYEILGVNPAAGALAVVRPDGYVGVVAELQDVPRIEAYLARCVRLSPSECSFL